MNRFLIYLSDELVETNAAGVLSGIGTATTADFNVLVLETEETSAGVAQTLKDATLEGGEFLVSRVEELSFRGGPQFGSAMKLLMQS